jgi:hypothetical protein
MNVLIFRIQFGQWFRESPDDERSWRRPGVVGISGFSWSGYISTIPWLETGAYASIHCCIGDVRSHKACKCGGTADDNDNIVFDRAMKISRQSLVEKESVDLRADSWDWSIPCLVWLVQKKRSICQGSDCCNDSPWPWVHFPEMGGSSLQWRSHEHKYNTNLFVSRYMQLEYRW